MSELQNCRKSPRSFRQEVLAGVSAASLLAALYGLQSAHADENDRPTVWIELGGQLERVDGGSQRFAPSFEQAIVDGGFKSPSLTSREPRYSNGIEGQITLQPSASDWKISAAIRYGRSNGVRSSHEETHPPSAEAYLRIPVVHFYVTTASPADATGNTDTKFSAHESHLVLDFQAGKDVGLGALGKNGSSVFSAGLRFAQFNTRSTEEVNANPDFAFSYKYLTHYFGFPASFKIPYQSWHVYHSRADISHSFHGLGPSVAWNADSVLIGDPERGTVTFDWGLNAALLFGRQKTKAHHETVTQYAYHMRTVPVLLPIVGQSSRNTNRSRSVVIPDVGALAGLSFRFPNAKISLGYRADFFFGAMDGGIDTRKTYDRNFYGPFATISVGLGG